MGVPLFDTHNRECRETECCAHTVAQLGFEPTAGCVLTERRGGDQGAWEPGAQGSAMGGWLRGIPCVGSPGSAEG